MLFNNLRIISRYFFLKELHVILFFTIRWSRFALLTKQLLCFQSASARMQQTSQEYLSIVDNAN